MDCSVESYRNFEGERCVDLIDNSCGLSKCFWLSTHLREFRTFQTALTYAYQAKYYFEYFDSQGIDIVKRVELGDFFTKGELEQYMTHSLYKLEHSPSLGSNVHSIAQFSTKSLDNLIHSTRSSKGRVAVSTSKIRINSLIKFITFLYDQIHAAQNVSSNVVLRYKDNKDRASRYVKKIKPNNSVVKDEFEQIIPTDVYFRLIEITRPHNADNPWSKLTRFRNHLIVQLFNETGIRIGALCKLKISDLVTNKPTRIKITRTPNDPSDPRARPPAQKTKAHTSAVSPELMQRLLLYINTNRAKHQKSINHDFLFVSDKGLTAGQPISIQGVQDMFVKLSESLNFKIHPHLTRHKFQEIFEDAGISIGLSPERIEDLRRFASGWSENSKMTEIYNEHKIAVAAREVSKEAQRAILSGLKELN